MISALLTLVLRWWRYFVAVWLLVVPPILNAQPVAGVAGTMPEDYLPGLKNILAVALKQSPTMLQQDINLTQAEVSRMMSESPLWPSLGAGGSYGYNNSRGVDNGVAGPASVSSGVGYSLSFGQPIFQWGALKMGADIAKLGQQVTQRQLAMAYRTLAGTLRSQYIGLVIKKLALRNSRYQLKLQETNLAVQEAMLNEGAISSGDIIGPRLAVDEQRLALDRSEQEFSHSKRLFQRLAGLDDLQDDSIPDGLAHPVYPLDAADALLNSFTHGGVDSDLQVQVDALTVKQQDLSYKIARTGLYPKFSFGAGYSLGNSVGVSAGVVSQSFTKSYSYSISGGWTLFDGFRTRASKISALATKRSAERQLRTDADTTIETAVSMRKQLELADRALGIAELRRALAEDALKRSTEEFKEGTVSQSALDSSTSVFNQADYAAISARADSLARWSDFVSLLGADPALNALPASYLTPRHGK